MKQPFNVQIFSHEPMTLNSSTSLPKTTNYQLMTENEVSTYLHVCRRSLFN
jgi:hypothetical protein